MRYYIIAGEASGDLHASNLVRSLRAQDATAEFRGFGGDRMRSEGVELFRHYKDTAYMGFTEVLMHLRTILRNIALCKKDISAYRPDVVILVDYPGFNLRIAPYAKEQGFKLVYYISPQFWAWKEKRVEIIKKYVDAMLVILPFETAFYQKHHYTAHFVGHPLLDAIAQFTPDPQFREKNALGEKNIIAVLPGSRKQEINIKLPVMLSLAEDFPAYQFVVACAPSLDDGFYDLFAHAQNVSFVRNATYDLLHISTAAMVTSGTATLETALFHVPEVVCYKGSAISYAIAKRLVKVKYISLVNLIADAPVVPELIQQDMHKQKLSEHLRSILPGGEARHAMLQAYTGLENKLGGGASEHAASFILKMLS